MVRITGNGYSPKFGGMLVLPMTAFGCNKLPAIRFYHFDKLHVLSSCHNLIKAPGEPGFGPGLTDPESVVLPLHYSPIVFLGLAFSLQNLRLLP